MAYSDEHDRYVEYLQGQLLTPEWGTVFDAGSVARWWSENSERLQAAGRGRFDPGAGPVEILEHLHRDFQPRTKFELPQTAAIFAPLLERVKIGAAALGLKPVRNVRLATSTDVSATPVARPTAGDHILFVGPGTAAFCNYWAKAFTALVRTIAHQRPTQRVESPQQVRDLLRNDPTSVLLAARLALHYVFAGTLLGFGEVHQPPDYLSYRVQLLRSMEMFAVAHEYSHFVAEEDSSQLEGVELELVCDGLGLQISRNSADEGDWLSFAGIGALIFFRSMQICEVVRHLLGEASRDALPTPKGDAPSTHPPLEDRISSFKSILVATTVEDQREHVVRFLDEYDLFASELLALIHEAAEPVSNERLDLNS